MGKEDNEEIFLSIVLCSEGLTRASIMTGRGDWHRN